MKLLLILITTLLSLSSFSYVDVSKNPIYHAILIAHQKIDKMEAFKYSEIIAHYSKKYNIDPFLVVAITRHESYINLKATREAGKERIIFDAKSKKFTRAVEVTDFCMMQINKGNVIWKKLDPERLISDADYCIHEGMKVLVYFQPLKKEDPFWWTRYNSSLDEARSIYKSYILSHYNKIASGIANFELIRRSYTSSEMFIAMEDIRDSRRGIKSR